MKRFLRQLKPKQMFTLCRTGQQYLFIRRDPRTPSGTAYIVYNYTEDRLSKLHHSCHVELLNEDPALL